MNKFHEIDRAIGSHLQKPWIFVTKDYLPKKRMHDSPNRALKVKNFWSLCNHIFQHMLFLTHPCFLTSLHFRLSYVHLIFDETFLQLKFVASPGIYCLGYGNRYLLQATGRVIRFTNLIRPQISYQAETCGEPGQSQCWNLPIMSLFFKTRIENFFTCRYLK